MSRILTSHGICETIMRHGRVQPVFYFSHLLPFCVPRFTLRRSHCCEAAATAMETHAPCVPTPHADLHHSLPGQARADSASSAQYFLRRPIDLQRILLLVHISTPDFLFLYFCDHLYGTRLCDAFRDPNNVNHDVTHSHAGERSQ
jgi:hypothetical protein